MGCVPSTDKHSTKVDKQSNPKQPGEIEDKHAANQTPNQNGETASDSTKPGIAGIKPIGRNMSIRLSGMPDYASIRNRYKLLDLVGQGKFGVVYKAESKSNPDQLFAIKIVKCINAEDKKLIMDEVKILKDLDHPNIIKYYEAIEEDPYVFIVTEYCSGGELLERISGKTVLGESDAAEITSKVLMALNHCHSKGIAHRDIKPENIMYSNRNPDAEIKIIDFGLAKRSDRYLQSFKTIVGTPYFIAPEVIEGNYSSSCDIWSVGVVLHLMLAGEVPFNGRNDTEIFRNIRKGTLSFDNPVWKRVTPPGQDLVSKLLDPDDSRRPTASEALKHEWFSLVKTYPPELDVLDPTIVNSIQSYHNATMFQKLCMNVFVKTLKDKEIHNLVIAFNMLDKEKNGFILAQDMLKVFHEHHPDVDIKELAERMNLQGNKPINYSQFIASAINAKEFLTNERLWALFKYLDVTSSDFLTAEDIREVINQNADRKYTIEEVKKMLEEVGIKQTDHISFEQFSKIMIKMEFNPGEETLQKVIK